MRDEVADQAMTRLEEILNEARDILAPRSCPHAEIWRECDIEECTFKDTRPADGMMLSEFAVITSWEPMTPDREAEIMIHTPTRQRDSHTKGLLFKILHPYG